MEELQKKLKEIENYSVNLFNKDFLLTWEQPLDHIKVITMVARLLRDFYRNGVSCKSFEGGLAVSLFRDKSTRTRFSFASAASLLGLSVMDLDETKSQISHGETVRETATMISFLTETIGIRDDLFLGEGHEGMVEYSEAIDIAFKNGIIPQRPSVINLQCDRDHPTQTLADLIHLIEKFGSLDNLAGKKIAMTWAFSPSYGKPMSVPQGIIALMTRFGMKVSLAYPEGYDLIPDIVKIAEENARKSGGSFEVVHSMEEAFNGADVVYPKSWAPYNVMKKRTELIRKGKAGLKELEGLENECIEENRKYKNWECNDRMMKLTKNGKALYMHCLPADITGLNCDAGEVSNDVFDRYKFETYKEAEHKLYVIAAMILLTRFDDINRVLHEILKRDVKRKI